MKQAIRKGSSLSVSHQEKHTDKYHKQIPFFFLIPQQNAGPGTHHEKVYQYHPERNHIIQKQPRFYFTESVDTAIEKRKRRQFIQRIHPVCQQLSRQGVMGKNAACLPECQNCFCHSVSCCIRHIQKIFRKLHNQQDCQYDTLYNLPFSSFLFFFFPCKQTDLAT